eukprot:snap_masked-scaffold_4-processed-gene-16.20-mRNA-1 protein AED:1.00 eAED:1.00 QI:0/-1/0/0/-1/1/1/0/66
MEKVLFHPFLHKAKNLGSANTRLSEILSQRHHKHFLNISHKIVLGTGLMLSTVISDDYYAELLTKF